MEQASGVVDVGDVMGEQRFVVGGGDVPGMGLIGGEGFPQWRDGAHGGADMDLSEEGLCRE